MSIALLIEESNPTVSIQDGGRRFVQRYGLSPGGAMDRRALARANALVGKAMDAAAIEIGPFGFALRAESDVMLALSGARRRIALAGRPAAPDRTLHLRAGERLVMGPAETGLYAYLAFAGELAGTPMFGSYSVNARAGLGAPLPRALQANDRLVISPPMSAPSPGCLAKCPPEPRIRVVAGPQRDMFGAAYLTFLAAHWRISTAVDRMGCRLEGPDIASAGGHDIVTDGTVTGSVQVPGNRQPLVLLPDRGTTGGYPKIATIITPDLGWFAQLRPGETFRFADVSIEEAQRLTIAYWRDLESFSARVQPVSNTMGFDLASANLAGNAVNAADMSTWMDHSADGPSDA